MFVRFGFAFGVRFGGIGIISGFVICGLWWFLIFGLVGCLWVLGFGFGVLVVGFRFVLGFSVCFGFSCLFWVSCLV